VLFAVWAVLVVLFSGCADSSTDSTGATTDDSGTNPNQTPPALELDGDPKAGATIFEKTCGAATCHGPDGSGGTTNAKDLREVVPELSDRKIVKVMTAGYLVMPPQRLEDQEMADVLAYLREEWGGG
jgi:mono/diheme cytochrome c family protein